MILHYKLPAFIRNISILLLLLLVYGTTSYAQATVGGIGVLLGLDTTNGHTLPVVKKIFANSPTAPILKDNMFVLKVNGIDCRDKSIDAVVALIRGDAGTHITLTVADNVNGKGASDHDIVRVAIALADAATVFNSDMENEVKLLKKQGNKIVRTFTSDCGNFYFNFNTEPKIYHIKIYTLEEKGTGPYKKGFDASAIIFDNENEGGAIALSKAAPIEDAVKSITLLTGNITFKKEGVCTINTKINALTDPAKCKAMYIIVYSANL